MRDLLSLTYLDVWQNHLDSHIAVVGVAAAGDAVVAATTTTTRTSPAPNPNS